MEAGVMTKQELPHKHDQNIEFILGQMPGVEYFSEASGVFSQLCDGSRLRILWLLCHCEECGINIAAAVGMSNAAVSHHLKSLKLHGLIVGRREGKEVYYTLADTETARLIHRMVDDFFQMSCPSKGIIKHTQE